MNRKSTKQKRDWRQTVLVILSIFLILSMALGFVLPYITPAGQ